MPRAGEPTRGPPPLFVHLPKRKAQARLAHSPCVFSPSFCPASRSPPPPPWPQPALLKGHQASPPFKTTPGAMQFAAMRRERRALALHLRDFIAVVEIVERVMQG